MFLWAPRFPFPASIPGSLWRVSPIFSESWNGICRGKSEAGAGEERKESAGEKERVPESLPFLVEKGAPLTSCIPPRISHTGTLTLDTLSCLASRSRTPATPGCSSSGCQFSAPRAPDPRCPIKPAGCPESNVPFSAAPSHSQPQS